MQSMLVAVSAVLHHFDSVGVIFLVFLGNIVPVLALCAGESNFHAHCRHLLYQIFRLSGRKFASLFVYGCRGCGAEAQKRRSGARAQQKRLRKEVDSSYHISGGLSSAFFQ